jgi:CheY-like chemotaxis protein
VAPPCLRIAVIDTGIGITPENIPKLFQPFIQIDGALNRQYTGTGLGLVLVKRIVDLHGGQIVLTSEPGVGSCFAIDLPCAEQSRLPSTLVRSKRAALQVPVATSPVAASVDSLPASPLGTTVLLAEDNEANISTISNYLKTKGYRLLLARNGQEAIDLAKTHQPDVILMDIQMPGMDGLEAMRQIRREPTLTDSHIVALTALAMAGDREKCLDAGADDYLTKPVKLKQLVNTIQQLLGDFY